MNIFGSVFRKDRGEIATIVALGTVGILMLGLVVGQYIVQRQTKLPSKAQAALPDLIIKYVEVYNGTAAGTFDVFFTIQNSSAVSVPFTAVYVEEALYVNRGTNPSSLPADAIGKFPGLLAGDITTEVLRNVTLNAGQNIICATADHRNIIQESNEGNNLLCVTYATPVATSAQLPIQINIQNPDPSYYVWVRAVKQSNPNISATISSLTPSAIAGVPTISGTVTMSRSDAWDVSVFASKVGAADIPSSQGVVTIPVNDPQNYAVRMFTVVLPAPPTATPAPTRTVLQQCQSCIGRKYFCDNPDPNGYDQCDIFPLAGYSCIDCSVILAPPTATPMALPLLDCPTKCQQQYNQGGQCVTSTSSTNSICPVGSGLSYGSSSCQTNTICCCSGAPVPTDTPVPPTPTIPLCNYCMTQYACQGGSGVQCSNTLMSGLTCTTCGSAPTSTPTPTPPSPLTINIPQGQAQILFDSTKPQSTPVSIDMNIAIDSPSLSLMTKVQVCAYDLAGNPIGIGNPPVPVCQDFPLPSVGGQQTYTLTGTFSFPYSKAGTYKLGAQSFLHSSPAQTHP